MWRIDFSARSEKFLKQNRIPKDDILELLSLSIKKFQGEKVNIDIKKMKEKWDEFHRIRKGEIRIIAKFNFDNSSIFIDVIDWRGGAYK
ncbi:hypothetical protein A3I27_04615 [Candidatus Giovannonibacteria bacterium RIFCSPLOWO2_02_FULL_43_11b]|uniref:Uncharacterized protein n=1 Tax=Candidatus Giovannonibacteria bacterium RIFCSPHIGHO2_12_FULL_43_15 TaxID=1798341 RepID=A0A1F5WSE2_9BACT|nr:MAG: hypothetical protein A2739_02355 [Candidatus Giovannonibacteria bacterium RIFCSPHIGHO2_01_FULL_43_100]OGF67248.1 MAG: hypothetical protein A3B97_00350 [Candidatus Giovannonibacteria bacterium RIFCSPHIGHO2_02_FULL_43_32]OGF78241.1 MAG: hypothetical protein A3F23_02310 [Candidatus Giovannonibacteria bacterium RIFCSPHIGHO2_12_FULL_43_15]OGF78746.1 MAG: hypothetical protein A3A15_00800 [Candidatus Giovannonibacteria bacterium RIFCSPLOWO2_01_FULL_43_60]OGF90310.1 MAG: hypothetical protein A3